MTELVRIPATWPFRPPAAHADWDALGRLARGNPEDELSLLMEEAGRWDVRRKGPDGTPVLVHVLQGWGRQHNPFPHTKPPFARLPIPGEAPWTGTGNVAPWTLPAALLVARGADPFEVDAQGASGFSTAVAMGASALCQQMLRLPHAPQPAQWPHGSGGRTILQAAANGFSGTLQVLLDAGANPDVRDGAGRTPLMHTSLRNAEALLKAGANPLAADDAGLTCLEHWAIHESQATFRGSGKPYDRVGFWEHLLKTSVREPAQAPRAFLAALFFGHADLVRAVPLKPRRPQWIHTPGPFGLNAIEWGLVGSLLWAGGKRCLVDTLDPSDWPPDTQDLAQVVRSMRSRTLNPASRPTDNGCPEAALRRLAQVWVAAGLPREPWLFMLYEVIQWPKWTSSVIPVALDACARKIVPLLQAHPTPGSDGTHIPLSEMGQQVEAMGHVFRTQTTDAVAALEVPRMQLWGQALSQDDVVSRNNMGTPQPLVPLPHAWAGSPEAQQLAQEWPLIRGMLVHHLSGDKINGRTQEALALGDAATLMVTVPGGEDPAAARRHRM